MTTRARQEEADEASDAFQIALAQIGARTAQEALALWSEAPVAQGATGASGWLLRLIRLVLGRRRQARELSRAYYRLVRALRTGYTVNNPRTRESGQVTLAALREQFAELASGYRPPREGGSDRIVIEVIAGLLQIEDRLEADARRELAIVLAALGPEGYLKRLQNIDTDLPASDVDRLRDEARAQSGARQAAAASRVAMNGGRSQLWTQSERDRRALGYVRRSRTGTPCGWCAMLISRGAIFYSSERAATYGSDGDLYHDNCNCYAEPVFSRDQYQNSKLFELNRRYEELWPQVTKGLSGKAAVAAWRRFIRQESAARVARQSTSSVQEA